MSNTITVRLPLELVAWLDQTAKRSGVPRGRIIRDQLEQARDKSAQPAFMRLAGTIKGARDLSERKGFSRT
jgi:predicted transcriptional regulator